MGVPGVGVPRGVGVPWGLAPTSGRRPAHRLAPTTEQSGGERRLTGGPRHSAGRRCR
jgi:hypothetical protein